MALSDGEKQRIREEEVERLRARDEYRARSPRYANVVVFWAVLMAIAVLLWVVVRSGHR